MTIKSQNIFFIVLICFVITGCSTGEQENKNPMITQTSIERHVNQDISKKAIEEVLEREEVTRANAVNTDDLLLLAFEVQQFERFQLQSIEKKIKQKLKKKFKDVKVEVSYDEKIMLEIEQLQDKSEKEKMTSKKWKKEIKNIEKLMHEKT